MTLREVVEMVTQEHGLFNPAEYIVDESAGSHATFSRPNMRMVRVPLADFLQLESNIESAIDECRDYVRKDAQPEGGGQALRDTAAKLEDSLLAFYNEYERGDFPPRVKEVARLLELFVTTRLESACRVIGYPLHVDFLAQHQLGTLFEAFYKNLEILIADLRRGGSRAELLFAYLLIASIARATRHHRIANQVGYFMSPTYHYGGVLTALTVYTTRQVNTDERDDLAQFIHLMRRGRFELSERPAPTGTPLTAMRQSKEHAENQLAVVEAEKRQIQSEMSRVVREVYIPQTQDNRQNRKLVVLLMAAVGGLMVLVAVLALVVVALG